MDQIDDVSSSHRCTRWLYYAWKIFTCLFTHVMLVTMVVAYCILGAVTFESLERDNEIFVKTNITYMRDNVTEDLWSITKEMSVLHQENWTTKAISRIKLFENDLVLAIRKAGWDGSEEVDSLQWTFAGALFYSIIVITTIGYGHIAPKTHLGKVTTIFYAIVGIPLMLLCLSNIGDIMAHSFRFLYWRICCYACTRDPKRNHSTRRRAKSIRISNNGGRHSSRSRTASFRVSGRNSQRSADSALGLSEGLSGIQSVSDNDSRYYAPGNKDDERGPGSFRQSSAYQNESDSVPRKYNQSSAKVEADIDIQPSDTPVLFNKYAIDPEDFYKGRGRGTAILQHPQLLREDSVLSVSSTNGNGKWTKRNTLNIDSSPHSGSPRQRSSEYSGRRTHDSSPMTPSPRIMSPMGFIVPRQTTSKSNDYYITGYSDYGDEMASNQTKPVPIWLCVFLVVSYIIGGAFLFSDWEDWGYADSAYFCFITLTTIGFGDFVPAQRVNKKNGEMSIALCSLYLLFGIALLAMSFNLVQEEVINNVKAVARHLGIIKDNTIENNPDYVE